MKMKVEGNQLIIADVDAYHYNIIKSWNAFKYNRQCHWLEGAITAELLNRLAKMVELPAPIEATRKRLNDIQAAVDRERLREDPKPLYNYPIKKDCKLFKHQIRGANMALLTFGLIPLEKEEKVYGKFTKDEQR